MNTENSKTESTSAQQFSRKNSTATISKPASTINASLNSQQRCKSYSGLSTLNRSPSPTLDSRHHTHNHHVGFSKLKTNLKKNIGKVEKYFHPQKLVENEEPVKLHSYKSGESDSKFNTMDSTARSGFISYLNEAEATGKPPSGKQRTAGFNSLGASTGNAVRDSLMPTFSHSQSLQEQQMKAATAQNHADHNNNSGKSSATSLYGANVGAMAKPSATHQRTVPIVHNSVSSPGYYIIDRETLADLNRKLAALSLPERLDLQQKGYELLEQQTELKKATLVSLRADLAELNEYLVNKNEPVRSTFEVDVLRGEIRNLTNEKARLEFRISQKSNWQCQKCTYSNESNAISCVICGCERDVGEIFICSHCNTKNPLTSVSCAKCHHNFTVESDMPHGRRPSNGPGLANTPQPPPRKLTNASSNSSLASTPTTPPGSSAAMFGTGQPNIPFVSGVNSPLANIRHAQSYLFYNNNNNAPQSPSQPPTAPSPNISPRNPNSTNSSNTVHFNRI